MTGSRRLAALLSATFITLACATGCADRAGDDRPQDDGGSAFPAEVTVRGQEAVTVPDKPQRIVSLSPSATEMLYAIGAGEQVVAVDEYSNFPERAPQTALSGFTTDAGALGEHDPDLVIAQDNATELADGLRKIDVPTVLTPSAASLDDTYQQLSALGQATGHTKQADDLIRTMRRDIDKIVEQTPTPSKDLSYFHEISPDFYTSTSDSYIGSVYSLFGLNNIADSAAGKFPQLSEEHVLKANPDMIFLADGQTPEKVRARPGWDTITAVREQHIIPLDGDVASRWGPRVVDLVRAVGDAVTDAQNDR